MARHLRVTESKGFGGPDAQLALHGTTYGCCEYMWTQPPNVNGIAHRSRARGNHSKGKPQSSWKDQLTQSICIKQSSQ